MNVESISSNQYSSMIRQKPEDMIKQLIKNKDEDGDNALSINEFGSDNNDFFNKIDSDSDGLLTEDEMLSDMKQQKAKMESQLQSLDGESILGMQRMPPPPKPEEIFDQIDSDDDNQLTIDELGATDEEFSQLDTNGDGVVSQDELKAFMDNKKAEMDAKKESLNSDNEFLSTQTSSTSTDNSQNIFDILFNTKNGNYNSNLNLFG